MVVVIALLGAVARSVAVVRELQPNDVLANRYRVDRQIGAGGMGAVYLGFHLRLEVPVALKTCHLGLNITPHDRPDYLKRFKREARALTKLKHTNIVSVLDYDVVDDTPFLVMEYFKGFSILGWGEDNRPTPQQWLRVFRPLFDALAVAHRSGIVHRDIKSPNVLVRGEVDDPEVMLIDWGVAFDESLSGLTQQDAVVGSPGCIDPARYFGAPYTPKSDLYAMGSLMYWALTGQPAIVPRDGQTKHDANAENRVKPPHEVNPEIAGDLEEFLLALLETEPDNRPPSALACAAIVESLVRGEEVAWEAVYAKYPQKPFVPAADLDDDSVVVPADAGLTVRFKPPTQADNVASIAISNPGDVVIEASPQPKKNAVSPAAQLERNLAQLGVKPRPRKLWRVLGFAAAAIVGVLSLVVLAQRETAAGAHEEPPMKDATLGALVTPEDIERATKAAPPALEQALQAKTSEVSNGSNRDSGNRDSLDSFSPDIRARYATSPDGTNAPFEASQDTLRDAGKNTTRDTSRTARKAETTPPTQPMSLGIVPAATDSPGAGHDNLTIPHGTRTAAFLMDLLDTSSNEPVRAELRTNLRVDNNVVVPVGAMLVGSASLRDEVRAQANFTKVVLRDGREFPIRAAAILKDGREGISGGQFEYGDAPKGSDGGRVLAETAGEALIDVAAVVLPGADALSRTGKHAIARETEKLRDQGNKGPRKRDRMIVNRGTELLIQFRAL